MKHTDDYGNEYEFSKDIWHITTPSNFHGVGETKEDALIDARLALMAEWKNDPCWDIFDTEGFEMHKPFLEKYQAFNERKWQRDEINRLEARANELQCSVELVKHIEKLERRIQQLEDAVYSD